MEKGALKLKVFAELEFDFLLKFITLGVFEDWPIGQSHLNNAMMNRKLQVDEHEKVHTFYYSNVRMKIWATQVNKLRAR